MTDLIIGADISTLPEVEAQGGHFYEDGKEVLLDDSLIKNGYTSCRIRVWNDPYTKNGEPYGGGTCDLKSMIALAKRLKSKGMSFMLDLHYSDFWCDPARQGTPKAWKGMTLDEMCDALYEYTKSTVRAFTDAGAEPEYVQVGNEITNGMLWDTAKLDRSTRRAFVESFERLAKLLKAGARGVRETTKAKIIIHLEQSGKNDLRRQWFDELSKYDVEYDIIGASYYPLWHGLPEQMRANMEDMAMRYRKDIMIVETAYPFTTVHHDPSQKRLMIDDDFVLEDGSKPRWSFTKEGQKKFLEDLYRECKAAQGGRILGFYYWEPGWLPTKEATWATREALIDIGEEDKGTGNEWANECLFDYSGNANPALYTFAKSAE